MYDDTATGARDAARRDGGEYRPRYNGWKNRETWNLALWISNEEALADDARALVAEAMRAPVPAAGALDPYAYRLTDAAAALRNWMEEVYIDQAPPSSPIADAWLYALDCADWTAIAAAMADELPEVLP